MHVAGPTGWVSSLANRSPGDDLRVFQVAEHTQADSDQPLRICGARAQACSKAGEISSYLDACGTVLESAPSGSACMLYGAAWSCQGGVCKEAEGTMCG